MLEAKGQGHRSKCSKKKGTQKIFSGDLKKKKKAKEKVFKTIFQAISKWKKNVFPNFPQNVWRFPTKFLWFKNSAVLKPRTGQFSRTWGFEAEVKPNDLTFKAEAKDFKMCPRERPQGVHLWTY